MGFDTWECEARLEGRIGLPSDFEIDVERWNWPRNPLPFTVEYIPIVLILDLEATLHKLATPTPAWKTLARCTQHDLVPRSMDILCLVGIG